MLSTFSTPKDSLLFSRTPRSMRSTGLRFCHLLVHRALYATRRHVSQHSFHLRFCGRGVDVVFARKQSLDTLARHIIGLAFQFSFRSNLCMVHSCSVEEIRIGWAGL